MIEDFLKEFAKLIVEKKDKIKIEKKEISESYTTITLYTDKEDTGKLIGKDGKTISALKTIISGCKAKDGISYKILVKAYEE